MELLVKKIFSKHSKLGNEAERFRRFEPENIFKIKKKRDAFHNRVSGNKRTTYIVRGSSRVFLNLASRPVAVFYSIPSPRPNEHFHFNALWLHCNLYRTQQTFTFVNNV